MRDYGTVVFEGNTLKLTQDAYCDNYGTDGEVRYYANATDAENNEYMVTWETKKEWDLANKLYALVEELKVLNSQKSYDDGSIGRMAELEEQIETMENEGVNAYYCEDESNACDWDIPTRVETL